MPSERIPLEVNFTVRGIRRGHLNAWGTFSCTFIQVSGFNCRKGLIDFRGYTGVKIKRNKRVPCAINVRFNSLLRQLSWNASHLRQQITFGNIKVRMGRVRT